MCRHASVEFCLTFVGTFANLHKHCFSFLFFFCMQQSKNSNYTTDWIRFRKSFFVHLNNSLISKPPPHIISHVLFNVSGFILKNNIVGLHLQKLFCSFWDSVQCCQAKAKKGQETQGYTYLYRSEQKRKLGK